MLKKLMKELTSGQVYDRRHLAKRLGVSEGLVTQMLEDLQRKGYLDLVSSSCASGGCSSCPFGSACSPKLMPRTWVLTEKGLRAAARVEGK